MKILLVRIGWMKFYNGSQPGDERPTGGGKYNKENKGGELYNFKKFGPYLYGSFAIAMSAKNLNLSRIQPGFEGESLKDVLVIFFSQHPDKSFGQVVIGWYKNAIVNKDWKEEKSKRMKRWYLVEAKISNSVLLPTYNRSIHIPRGQNTPGQSNTFFVYENNGILKNLNWLPKILSYIENYDGPNFVEGQKYSPIWLKKIPPPWLKRIPHF